MIESAKFFCQNSSFFVFYFSERVTIQLEGNCTAAKKEKLGDRVFQNGKVHMPA